MNFKINVKGKTYRVQFRLAVLCQVFEEGKYKFGRYISYQTEGIQNPEDEFSLFVGAKTAMTKMMPLLTNDKEERAKVWDKFFGLFLPWVHPKVKEKKELVVVRKHQPFEYDLARKVYPFEA